MSEFRRVRDQVMNMVARGVLSTTDDDEGIQQQQLSLLYEEGKVEVERFQNYGFSGSAPPDAEALVVFVGGGRDHGVVVAVDDRQTRFTGLKPGEVAIYTDEGDSIVLKRDNIVEITTKQHLVSAEQLMSIRIENGTVEIEATNIMITGDVHIDGDLDVTGSINGAPPGRAL